MTDKSDWFSSEISLSDSQDQTYNVQKVPPKIYHCINAVSSEICIISQGTKLVLFSRLFIGTLR